MSISNSKLPGVFISKETFEKYLHMVLQKGYSGNYTCEQIKENSQQMQYEIICGMGNAPVLLIVYIRSDGSMSISYKSGKNPELGKKITNAIYSISGRDHSSTNTTAMKCSQEIFNQVLSELDKSNLFRDKEKTFNNQTIISYSDDAGNKLTIQYWMTGKIFPQSKSQFLLTLFNDTYAKLVKFSSAKDVAEEIEAFDFNEEESMELEQTIEGEVGKDFVTYINQANPDLAKTLYAAYKRRLYDKTIELTDYTSLVQEMCRIYESAIKTIFLSTGVKEKEYTKDYFYLPQNPTILDRSVLKQLKDDSKRKRLAKLYRPFQVYRNPASHGSANDLRKHKVTSSYQESEKLCKEIASAMKEFYNIVKPFFNTP